MVHPVKQYRFIVGADTRKGRLTLLVRLLPVTGSGLPAWTALHYYFS